MLLLQKLIKNLAGNCYTVKLNTDFQYPNADILIGGPPCQPFSVGGNQKGINDARDGFPVFIDAVKKYNLKFSCLKMLEDFFIPINGILN